MVALPTRAAVLALRVLRPRLQKREVVVEDVLDAEEHVAESGAPHQRRQRRRHADAIGEVIALDDVVDVVEAGVDDRPAQRLEARDVRA